MKKITVVTVCYQAEDTIENTVQSVIEQTYSEIQYLIIDGLSTDGTLAKLEQYKRYDYITVLSEKDSGLYNAMNKGTKLATGDYIIFLNSGDVFHDKEVLADIAPYLQEDVVYGDVERAFASGNVIETYPGKYKPLWLLLQGRMMSHQAIFTKREIMQRYGFDETYRICADYDFLVRVLKDKVSMGYVNRVVSLVENEEGLSSLAANLDKMRMEDDRSLKKHFPFYYYMLCPLKAVVRWEKRKQE